MIRWIFILMLMSVPAMAQSAPVDVTAQKDLTWDRKAQSYVAEGDATAVQGPLTVKADKLTATYKDSGVNQVGAEGRVILSSPPYTAYGDHATYDIDKGYAVMTGNDLRIETPDEKLTAHDKIEFFQNENRMTAAGSPVVTRGADTLAADAMTATFSKDARGKMAITHMTADGHVVLTTQKERMTGDHAVYDVANGKAVVTGNIKIYQGESFIEGTRADIDMKTGMSQLTAAPATGGDGRVKGTFYPRKKAP